MALTNGEIQVIIQSNTLTSQLHRDPCFRDHVLAGQVPPSLLSVVTLSSGKHSPTHMKILLSHPIAKLFLSLDAMKRVQRDLDFVRKQ